MDYDVKLSYLKKELDKAKTERTRAEAKLESLNKQKEDEQGHSNCYLS